MAAAGDALSFESKNNLFKRDRARRFDDSTVIAPEFPGEHIDSMLKRFKKRVDNAGILRVCREREGFMPKPERRKPKSINASRRKG